jgi:hypothetical protein
VKVHEFVHEQVHYVATLNTSRIYNFVFYELFLVLPANSLALIYIYIFVIQLCSTSLLASLFFPYGINKIITLIIIKNFWAKS